MFARRPCKTAPRSRIQTVVSDEANRHIHAQIIVSPREAIFDALTRLRIPQKHIAGNAIQLRILAISVGGWPSDPLKVAGVEQRKTSVDI